MLSPHQKNKVLPSAELRIDGYFDGKGHLAQTSLFTRIKVGEADILLSRFFVQIFRPNYHTTITFYQSLS